MLKKIISTIIFVVMVLQIYYSYAWNIISASYTMVHALNAPLLLSLLYFYIKRQKLQRTNIKNIPIIKYENTENNNTKFRTFNGTMNAKTCPYMGSRGQPFSRNTFAYEHKDVVSAVKVAKTLLYRDTLKEEPLVNLLGGAWIQFMIHDWFVHKKTDKTKQIDNMTFNELEYITQNDEKMFINDTDHWWSGSQIYGSSKEDALKLYNQNTGLMNVDNYLPISDKTNMESVGFTESLWFGLCMLHYIFVLEHNRIVHDLEKIYPKWNGNRLYNQARLIVSAMISKIHTLEWTTAIIQHPRGAMFQNILFNGILGRNAKKKVPPLMLKTIGTENTNLLFGIFGNNLAYRDVNFGHSEEFSSVYRMHSLVPDKFVLVNYENNDIITEYNIEDTVLKKSKVVNIENRYEDIIYSLMKQKAGKLCLNNFPIALTKVPLRKTSMTDLAILDIYRDRERQVPRYNDFRKSLHLKSIETFEELTDDITIIEKLKSVYKNVDEIDLLIGTHAEKHLPGFIFGETIYTVFDFQTQRRIECDRFLTTDFNAKVYTRYGVKKVLNTNFKDIFIHHFPKLTQTLEKCANAFIPL